MAAAESIWTIGHGTRTEDEVRDLLAEHGIALIADVRAHPGSRRSPQFSRDVMPGWLEEAGVGYVHLEDLGGRRRRQDVPAEVNGAWQNTSFRNYADHTLSSAFARGVERLTGLASEQPTALMCAEVPPWRCHRLLISTALTARGWTVHHIMGPGAARVHRWGEWGAPPRAHEDGSVTYPPEGEES
ncbi:DUF488 domain-containing protein [Ruania suaedae]|uniref:DUF488 domain-containing protein n=1 Tax=Ruania suaedae TaxID=2897774 RepID=UPI001E37D6D9|nr:DUF488 domain-containing protein [Ruania suaedae]UFU02740.1 DUF488 domain-containing protein [Ruania suaedae]